uniref:ATP-binding cassette domain-containing protein n=1 Tax=uncultured Pseudophaeobacter sp. TaxID=1759421 RepID=UPI0025F87235
MKTALFPLVAKQAMVRRRGKVLVGPIDLTLEGRGTTIVIGPNGAGKTTTMECVEGLRTPERGTISVLALNPFKDAYQLQDRIGVQLQETQLQKR